MNANLIAMGYRGEDASRTRADSRRQPPWQSPSGSGPGATGSWSDGSRGYGQDEYATADGYGGYPQDGAYAGYGMYGQDDGPGQPAEYGYGQAGEYGQRAAYGDGGHGYRDDHDRGARYGEPPAYGQPDGYGYPRGDGDAPGNGYAPGAGYAPGNGYGQSGGYSHDGYAHGDSYPLDGGYGQPQGYGGDGQGTIGHAANGYGGTGGYPAQPGRHAQPGGYPALPAGSGHPGGHPALPAGSGHSGGHPVYSGGYPGQSGDYPAQSGYPVQSGGSGGYPVQSGDYPIQGHGSDRSATRADIAGRYAGSDWYGGQPETASGAGFADTGTYSMDARTVDSYGTGPRAAAYGAGPYDQGEQETSGYEPDGYHGYQGSTPAELAIRGFPPPGALPARPETGAPPGLVHTGQQERLAHTRQQDRLVHSGQQDRLVYTGQQERYDDDYESYPGYDQDTSGGRRGYDTGYAGEARQPHGYDDYDEPAAFGADGYDPAAGAGVARDSDYDDYADGDPRQDRYGDGAAPRPAGTAGTKSKSGKRRGKRPLLLAALAVATVVVLGAAAYVFILKPKPSSTGSPAAAGPLPTSGSTSAATADCVKTFGEYCHIELRTDDPTPLTLDELFPPQFLNETDHASFTRAATRADTNCANAVIGQDLINALQSGKCTQVLRASYVSGDSKIMGTIGVVNLGTTNEAHYAGKVVGANDFVTPLSTSKGITSKLGKGTGVVEAEFKGHYLILTWAEFTTTNAPKTKAQDQQLEQFENDLVAGTANISLSQRMINGKPATAAAG
jgi:hypothetical protein